MSDTAQLSNSSSPRRSFGTPNALGIQFEEDGGGLSASQGRRQRRIISTSESPMGFLSRLRSRRGANPVKLQSSERPPIPSALHQRECTPLPALSMIVLSITMLGEFLSANVAMPFLLFMVKGFHEFEDEADIAFYTGVLGTANEYPFSSMSSSLSSGCVFLDPISYIFVMGTSATVAERHGRRIVLTLSLLGSAGTVVIFGTCTSLQQALATRLLQGIFAGAVGVARGTVASVTDATNEGRAYAILGFCWGIGGVAGAIIGGSFERPAEKWPETFGQTQLLVEYPYLLPCAIAGAITMTGELIHKSAMNVDNTELYPHHEALVEEDEMAHDQDYLGLTPPLAIEDIRPQGPHLDQQSITTRSPLHGTAGRLFTPRTAMEIYRPSSGGRSIFSHPGVRTPSAVLDALSRVEMTGDALVPAPEHVHSTDAGASEDGIVEAPPSLMSQLPIPIIIQYGLLALHSTTHDQVFLSYLVTDYQFGGLGLNPGHFSQLTQIVYQFYLYPNIGPPRGRFSHLSMFRLGSLLFIPAYLTVTMYRAFTSPSDEGNFVLMADFPEALALSTAVRFCGSTFGYTAVSILLNYMTPPHTIGFANGVAQSILWSISTQDNPSGYPMGFFACAGSCAFAVFLSLFIR
ncbi:hypothetical protein ID866_3579 [Astraeus odoratus]|nr:hypothetical protein ID866_3579 [Astraeus odoratus]